MQHLLTEQEFNDLKTTRRIKIEKEEKELFEFCQLAAMHIPIKVQEYPDKEAEPWGCIYTKEPNKNPMHCDKCPAREFCPADKDWSK